MLVAFVVNDIYYFLNRKRLAKNFGEKDLMSVKRLDLVHYLLKTASVVWPFCGLFTGFWQYFLVLLLIWLGKFVVYHLYTKAYVWYSLLLPLMTFVLYSIVFVSWITH